MALAHGILVCGHGQSETSLELDRSARIDVEPIVDGTRAGQHAHIRLAVQLEMNWEASYLRIPSPALLSLRYNDSAG